MIIKDDRTEEQLKTHTVLIVGTDSFMSGWGGAEGGASYAAWACPRDDWRYSDLTLKWVQERSEMKRVRVVYENGRRYRPGPQCAHLHIYVVGENHPALEGRPGIKDIPL